MISPTARAIFLMLLGLPVMVGIALLRPDLWIVSAGWIALTGGLMLLDAMIGPALRAFEVDVGAPPILYAGDSDPLPVTFRFTRGALPARLEVQLETNELLEDLPHAACAGGREMSAAMNSRSRRCAGARQSWSGSGAAGGDRWALSRSVIPVSWTQILSSHPISAG